MLCTDDWSPCLQNQYKAHQELLLWGWRQQLAHSNLTLRSIAQQKNMIRFRCKIAHRSPDDEIEALIGAALQIVWDHQKETT